MGIPPQKAKLVSRNEATTKHPRWFQKAVCMFDKHDAGYTVINMARCDGLLLDGSSLLKHARHDTNVWDFTMFDAATNSTTS